MPRSSQYLPIGVAIISLLIVIGLLWVPVGLHKSIGVFEEWTAINLIIDKSITEIVPAPEWPTRPLRWLPHVIAYHLSPNSHVGYNIYLIALFVMRGVASFLLARELLKSTALGLAAAGLFLVYPADSGWFTFRAITIQTALVFGLFSLYLLILYWNQPRRWLWFFILGTQVVSLLTYELLYGVFGLAPLLFLWLDGRLTLSRRLIRVSLLWYSTYIVLALRFLYIVGTGGGGYVSERLENPSNDSFSDKFIPSLQKMYTNHLHGWNNISDEHLILSLAIGVIFAIAVGWLMRPRQVDTDVLLSRTRYPVLLLAGLIWMLVTYVQYIPAMPVKETFRVYFVPSFGAALLVATVVYGLSMIARLESVLFPLCIGALMFIGGQNAIAQNVHYADQSLAIQRLLSTIVAEIPEPVEGTVFVVVDEQEFYQADDILAGRSDHLRTALNYIYDDRFDAILCTIDPRRPKSCQFTADGIVETSTSRDYVRTFDYENLIIFYTRWDGAVVLLEEIPLRYYASADDIDYNPHRLVKSDAELPCRVYTFFTCWPFTACDHLSTETITPVASAHVDFGETVPGGGWQQFHARSIPSRRIIANAATLQFVLIPDQAYQLSFETSIVAPQLADNLVVEVDNQPLVVTYSQEDSRFVFSSENPFFIDEETVLIRFRLAGDGDLRAIRFFSLDIIPAK
ncbi:MAG: hypothetical protein L0154_21565 [Chloroflexi bacterium]|nr:hypothetical protein [Chloroflexota bacterium]